MSIKVMAFLRNFREALIKSDVQIAPSKFSSEKCKNCEGILTDFKQFLCCSGGKFASKLCIKAHAVIYSEVP